MKIQEWLYVGIKLLAVYFAVMGAALLVAALVGLVLQMGVSAVASLSGGRVMMVASRYTLYSLLEPVCYLAAAWMIGYNTKLIFTLLRVSWPAELDAVTPGPTGSKVR